MKKARFLCLWHIKQLSLIMLLILGVFLVIVRSRRAHLHRLMRGMFPLQVIRYLRGNVVARRLEKRKREGWRARREKNVLYQATEWGGISVWSDVPDKWLAKQMFSKNVMAMKCFYTEISYAIISILFKIMLNWYYSNTTNMWWSFLPHCKKQELIRFRFLRLNTILI